ncbi:MAG: hypothetical protein NZ893_02865, partial [Candidatus Aenigmarchaeota archaeon]|nr:hypothetical protein [Candidatus Aenigmarchaeota archaeon]
GRRVPLDTIEQGKLILNKLKEQKIEIQGGEVDLMLMDYRSGPYIEIRARWKEGNEDPRIKVDDLASMAIELVKQLK